MTKIKEILIDHLEAKDHGGFDIKIEGIDTAASAIEKVHDEEMVGFHQWIVDNFCRSHKGYSVWLKSELFLQLSGQYLTSAQLLHLYKNK